MSASRLTRFTLSVLKAGIFVASFCTFAFAQGKNPVILIPGVSGSELRHKVTNERIWFRALKPKSEDLRLPISLDLSKNRDDLIPGDVLREVKIGVFPVTDVYGDFIKEMRVRGGYQEESWESPSDEGFHDSLYVYPYDWRLDNVLNARLLVRKIEALRIKLKRPDLKFDVVAHSMGGIITRYALMYGDVDLPAGSQKIRPTWAGAKLFDKVILMATPNEGSALALDSLTNGLNFGGLRIDLPFVQDTSKFTLFTLPSGYQLLPAPGTFRAFDERLQPISIDIYDPKVWTKYGWSMLDDKDFDVAFKPNSKSDAAAFFAAVLNRAKRLHEALAAAGGKSGGVLINVVGADCGTALDAVVIYRDKKADKWKTLFQPKGFTNSDGRKISAADLKHVMYLPGDGVVTQRSLRATTMTSDGESRSSIGSRSDSFICGEHHKLAGSSRIQEYVIRILSKITTDDDLENKGR